MIYKVITPESEADPNYAQFEYMLGWYDFNGNWQQYLFTDWDNKRKYDNEVFNNKQKESGSVIGSILNDEEDRVLLTVEDSTLQDVQVFLSIFRNERVIRIFKDGTTQAVAPDSNSVTYPQRGIRYQFGFELIQVPSYEIRG
jgi:hypothetical protein